MAASRMRLDTEDAIAKVVGAWCHHVSENEDMEMSGVSGGCSFVSSSCFTEFLKLRDENRFINEMALTGRARPHRLSSYYNISEFRNSLHRYMIRIRAMGIPDVTDSDYTCSEDDDEASDEEQ